MKFLLKAAAVHRSAAFSTGLSARPTFDNRDYRNCQVPYHEVSHDSDGSASLYIDTLKSIIHIDPESLHGYVCLSVTWTNYIVPVTVTVFPVLN